MPPVKLPATLSPAVPITGLVLGAGLLGLRWFRRDARLAERISEAYSWASPELAEKIVVVAEQLGADPYALANLINFESGGNPRAVNGASGATGLIQFLPSTASRLGTSTSALRSMSAVHQMDYVLAYLTGTMQDVGASSLRTPHSLAMAVFYPKAIRWPRWAMFPLAVIKSNGWKIFTPEDYVERMTVNAKLPSSAGLFA